MKDLREWLDFLQKSGHMARVQREVSYEHEFAAVTKKLDGKKAVFFENVKDSTMPLVCNIVPNKDVLAEGVGVCRNKLSDWYSHAVSNPIPCKEVGKGEAPVKENIITDPTKIDMGKMFPLPIHHEKDSGRYLDSGVCISKSPVNGEYNMAIYRMQLNGPAKMGICMQMRHQWKFFKEAQAQGKPLEIAVAVGVDPLVLLASQATLRQGDNELEVAGALKGEALEVVKCETVDLLVPARAEIIIEGRVLPYETALEAPFGEYMSLYGQQGERQVYEVTGVSFRNNTIYHTILTATMEHLLLGGIGREASLMKSVQQICPNVTAVHMPVSGSCRYTAVVAIDQQKPGEAKNVFFGAMASHENIRTVVVVDSDIDITDTYQVEWAISTRCRPETGVLVIPGTAGAEAAGTKKDLAAKLCIDATIPMDEDRSAYMPIRVKNIDSVRLEDYISD